MSAILGHSIVIGPIIVGCIFGFIVGSRIHLKLEGSFVFTSSAIIALIIGAILMACDFRPISYYNDVSIATTFLATIFRSSYW